MDDDEPTGLVVATADKDPVMDLSTVAHIPAQMERTEAVLVRRAHDNGATWVEIAAALGVSKRAMQREYQGRRVSGDRS